MEPRCWFIPPSCTAITLLLLCFYWLGQTQHVLHTPEPSKSGSACWILDESGDNEIKVLNSVVLCLFPCVQPGSKRTHKLCESSCRHQTRALWAVCIFGCFLHICYFCIICCFSSLIYLTHLWLCILVTQNICCFWVLHSWFMSTAIDSQSACHSECSLSWMMRRHLKSFLMKAGLRPHREAC